MEAQRLVNALADSGFTEFSGVPCSILEPIRVAAEARPDTRYLPATVEGEAVAVAAGHWLGGGEGAVVLLQNSGLGNVVNPLASLLVPYRIPALLVVSWRGQPDVPDAVHHYPMGAATLPLLQLLSIPYQVLDGSVKPEAAVSTALQAMRTRRSPAALVVPRGAVNGSKVGAGGSASPKSPGNADAAVSAFGNGAPMDRATLVAAVAARFRGEATVSTTGYMSRALAAHGPCGEHFYMQGSMGFAAAIALGVARARPGRRVLVLDGDGALLMRLGTLATIGHAAPTRLVHVVGDNACYASTGGQPSAAANTSFPRVALACGYRRAASCAGADELDEALCWAAEGDGPTLLHVSLSPAEAGGADRPEAAPEEIATVFRAQVGGRA